MIRLVGPPWPRRTSLAWQWCSGTSEPPPVPPQPTPRPPTNTSTNTTQRSEPNRSIGHASRPRRYPSYTNAEVRTALEGGAEDLGEPGRDNEFGHGLANYQGAEMRLGAPSAPPSPPAPPPPSLPSCPLGDVCVTGPCLITDGGSCATSPDFPNDYPVDEGCTIYSLPPVGLDVIAFDVEGDSNTGTDYDGDGDPANDCPFDYLIVNGVKYCGTSGPAGVVPSNGTMTWVSDGEVTESGWKARAPFSCSLHTALLSSRAHPNPVPKPLCPLIPGVLGCAAAVPAAAAAAAAVAAAASRSAPADHHAESPGAAGVGGGHVRRHH